jgi:hypothetical protein
MSDMSDSVSDQVMSDMSVSVSDQERSINRLGTSFMIAFRLG